MVDVVDQDLKCAAIDRLNHVRGGVDEVQNPFKDFLLIHEIASVDCAELVTVESQSGQSWQVVLLLNAIIAGLDKVNVFLLALVVDVLELVQNLLRLLVAFWVWKMREKSDELCILEQ